MPRVLPSKIVELIDHHFPTARTEQITALDRQFADRIAAIVRLVDELPPELMTLSGTAYNDYVVGLEGLRSTLSLWNSGASTDHPVHTRVSIQLIALRKALASLSDQHIPSDTAALAFIKDRAFRNTLRADIADAERANDNDEWKAATVFAGSVIEALLLWKLAKEARARLKAALLKLHAAGALKSLPSSNDPNMWDLAVLIEMAKELKIITDDTYHAATAARNFPERLFV